MKMSRFWALLALVGVLFSPALFWRRCEKEKDRIKEAFAQEVTAAANLSNVTVAWDAPTMNEDGSPLTDLGSFEIVITPASEDTPQTILSSQSEPATVTQARLEPEDVPDGPVRIWARAVDLAGNASEWSNSIEMIQDTVAPSPIIITIKIEIKIN